MEVATVGEAFATELHEARWSRNSFELTVGLATRMRPDGLGWDSFIKQTALSFRRPEANPMGLVVIGGL
jgi:hypothetical protein